MSFWDWMMGQSYPLGIPQRPPQTVDGIMHSVDRHDECAFDLCWMCEMRRRNAAALSQQAVMTQQDALLLQALGMRNVYGQQ